MNKKLKDLRLEAGLTQEELSKHIEVTTSSIGMYESGTRNPSYEVIIKLADFFNVSVDYLLDRTDCKNWTEVVYDKFSKSLSMENIEILTSDYPENIKKSIYSLLSTCLSTPLLEVNYNYTKKMHGKDIDWLYLVCKTQDILSMYFLDLKSYFYDDKSSCYFDMFDPSDIEALHNNVTKIMSNGNDSVSKETLIKISKNKALVKMRLELVIEQFEQLALYGSQSEILFENEILEYVKTPDDMIDRFTKLIKNDFITFADNVLSMRKYTDDSEVND